MLKKNILYITYDGLTGNLGESQIFSYIEGLTDAGNRFYVVSYEKDSDLTPEKKDKFQKLCKKKDITWKILRYHKNPPLISTVMDLLIGFFTVLLLLFKHKIDIIHFRSYVPGIIPLILKFFGCRAKVIFDLRGFWPEERVQIGICVNQPPEFAHVFLSPIQTVKHFFKYLLYLLFKYAELLYLKTFDAFVVLTGKAHADLNDRFGSIIATKPCFVIPTVVNTDKLQNITRSEFILRHPEFGYLSDRFVVVYAGSVGRRYDLKRMIEKFKQIQAIKPNAHFLFMTKEKQKINVSMKNSGIRASDYSIHYGDQQMVFNIYSISDLGLGFFISPVKTDPECLIASAPTKIYEYLYCNLPCIFSPDFVGDLQELSLNTKGLFPIDTPISEDFIESLSRIDIDKKNLINLTLKYGLEKYAELYSQLVQKSVLYITYDGLTGNLGESQILSYIEGLADRGIDFHILSFEVIDEHYEKRKEKISALCRQKNIQWTALQYHKEPRLFSTLFDITAGLIVSLKIVLTHRIDLIHFRSYVPGIIPLVFKLLGSKIKVIFDFRGFWPEERIQIGMCSSKLPSVHDLTHHPMTALNQSGKYVLYKIFKAIEFLFIKYFDAYVILTNQAKQDLLSRFSRIMGNKPCFVIPTVVNTNRIKPVSDTDLIAEHNLGNLSGKFIVVYAGSLGTRYDIQRMCVFFNRIKQFKPNAHFLFLTREKEMVINNCKRFMIDESDYTVLFTDLEQVLQLYSISDVGLAFYTRPFEKGVPDYLIATSPTKVHEYLICGLPAIVYPDNIGDIRELSRDNENLYLFSNLVLSNALLDDLSTDRASRLHHLKIDFGIDRYFELYKLSFD